MTLDSKYTVDNKSTWDAIPGKGSWVELRIVRLKSLFITMYKSDNGQWNVHKQFILNNLPNKIQAGCNISANAAFAFDKPFVDFNTKAYENIVPDMKVYIDYIRYKKPEYSNELRNLLNKQQLDTIPKPLLIKNFSF